MQKLLFNMRQTGGSRRQKGGTHYELENRFKIAAPAAACAGAFAFLVAPGRATRAQKAPFLCRNYAHRGLHTEDGSVPENSLPAFRAAAEAGYAVEMDVHLTADDRLVVFHDDTLERMCGVQGVIDDFTLAELRALRLGKTDCVIPTFAEALEALGGRVPLLLEIKRGHDNRRLCALTLEALRTYTGPLLRRELRSHDRRMVPAQRTRHPARSAQPAAEGVRHGAEQAGRRHRRQCAHERDRAPAVHRLQDRPEAAERASVRGHGRRARRLDEPRLDARARLRHRHLRALPSRRVVPRGHLSAGQACMP